MTTQTEVKHTPEPWEINDYINKSICVKFWINAKNCNDTIIEIKSYDNIKKAKANANFIIKACNSHYELLEACKSALNYINGDGYKNTIPKLQQAINKVEGKDI